MIEHIVLFQFQPDTSPEAIAAMMQGLKGLKEKIPGIVSLSCGENFSDRARGFTHGLVIRFVDRAALEVYQPHPAHQDVINTLIKPILAKVLAMDYQLL
ncbi:Dabb family protein [Roseofilum casamattae]|uniref:Dabb family protein n=1 Tax=Roseofilum casamattae BLCC-M143 TaxID=3022442 RepID=A0ABT7BZ36_9CYAN|nr:Dabb family protein [Roseofilum casamattae]MDJ1184426.1 Dabb family protein [Roseofilum casamattae BLCC-M143]